MKPNKLTIQAFSTYLDKTIVDFSKLNEHGLYLISGDTGAGKTTIYDAICYALYGEPSGSNRSTDVFRSSYAPLDMPTIVELDFELHDDHYIVHREQSYTKSGNKRPEIVTLSYKNELIDGKSAVNAKIRTLLGVDSEQFKQIVMIAQGEFTKLIVAKSEDRVKIFRDIFHTKRLMDFEDRLNKEAKMYEGQFQSSSTTLNTLLSTLNLEGIDEYNAHTLADIQNHVVLLEKELAIKEKAFQERNQKDEQMTDHYYQLVKINENILNYQSLLKKKQELDDSKDLYAKMTKDIEMLKKAKELFLKEENLLKAAKDNAQMALSLEHLHKEAQVLEQKTSLLDKEKENLAVYLKEAEDLRLEIAKDQELMDLQQTFHDNRQEMHELNIIIKNLKAQHGDCTVGYDKLIERMERDTQKVNELPDLIMALKAMDDHVNAINDRRNKLHDLIDLHDEFNQCEETHYERTNQYQEALAKYHASYSYYKGKLDIYMSQQAGHLAVQLHENEPCPVCGSIHHPHLAKLEGELLEAKDIETLEKRTNVLKEELDGLALDLTTLSNTKDKIRMDIMKLSQELDIHDEPTKELFIRLLNDVNLEETKKHKDYQVMQGNIEYLNKLRKSLETNQIDKKRAENVIRKLEEKLDKNEHLLTQKKTANALLEHQYPEISRFTQSSLLEKQELYKKKQDLITHIQNDEKQLSLLKTANSTKIQDLKGRIDRALKDYECTHTLFIQEINQSFDNEEHYHEILKQTSLLEKEKALNDYQVALHSTVSRLKDLEPMVKDKSLQDLSALKASLDAFKASKRGEDDQYQEAKFTYEHITDVAHKIKQEAKANEKIFEDYTCYAHLNSITSGKNASKMSFERYVLASYFEHILDYANVELERLTQGRFQFLRRTEVKGGAGQGLDLDVLDFETGTSRDVKSLSGGESFKASLALALGLSSMIQSYAGGIELNALFIDEGFGTLDEESLDQAIDVLMDLKSDSKVIGIISHVNELKDRIDAGIIVTRGKQGSHLKVAIS